MPPILEIRNIVKKYKSVTAVNDVSFSIQPEICFGLLGPNGAGKTTTIEIMEDVLSPSSGEILYKGKPRAASFRQEVGIQFQHTSLLSFLTVRETLETFRSLYYQAEDLEKLLDLCHLKEIQHRFNDKISGGQRQRLMLALALVNTPELVFLDEPSTGLDPQARHDLWDVVQKIRSKGNTIILTTHYMEEAQYLCDEIVIMDYGKIIAQGSPESLIRDLCESVTVVLPKNDLRGPLDQLPISFREGHDTIEIQTNNINACMETLLSYNIDLTDMMVRSPNLEDVFLNLTGRHLRD